jgi:diazepam-binding inhibitor (GABA receptor modulator, acyl-CoA-binding protein)
MKIDQLEEAVAQTKKFTIKPTNQELLKLYGLYKQATLGDNKEEAPSGFDFVAAAKHNSWLAFIGKSKDDAAESYIEFVKELSAKYL